MAGKRRGMNANAPTRWLTDAAMADLSGNAFTTHLRALMYGVEHETDGLIPAKALRLLVPRDADAAEVVAELVDDARLWTPAATGFQVLDWSASQTTKAEMARRRKGGAERQRRFQEGKRVDKRGSNASVTDPPQIRSDDVSSDDISTDEISDEEQHAVALEHDADEEQTSPDDPIFDPTTGEVFQPLIVDGASEPEPEPEPEPRPKEAWA